MVRRRHARRAVLLLMVLAVAALWAADQSVRAASARANTGATLAGSLAETVTGATAKPDMSPKATTARGATEKNATVPAATPQDKARNAAASGQLRKVTDAAGRVHYLPKKITQAERKAAAARLKAKRATAPLAAGGAVFAGPPLGGFFLGPNNQLIPDYSGVTANYAYSPPLTKFIDPLPNLYISGGPVPTGKYIPVAQAQPSPVVRSNGTVEGTDVDYYEIELGEYEELMHSELLPTRLRGYRQTNATDPLVGGFHYLGPVILAHKGKPVRVKFTNNLPTGAGGNLFIPVDTTVMGSGAGPRVNDATRVTTNGQLCAGAVAADCYTQNRATIHLHGGVTPWISDGTTHQWITPAGESTPYPNGVSVYNVPDMALTSGVPAGKPTSNLGSQTFYYTNDQSARLMFYHDHASGITRLNVYVGEAAGYVLTDPTEEALIAPSGPLAGLGYGIPLVIQDKTFVNPATIGVQDPTWNWGTATTTTSITLANGTTFNQRDPKLGDLWWPHVYMPAQNPYDISGTNAMGRWHYGPWFWPPTSEIRYLPTANPYYQAPCALPPTDPGYFACTRPEQTPEIPATPNPSWGAEAFMDTPVVNGTAFPTVTVPAAPTRLRILNAAHDRFWNLQLYVAADKNTATVAGEPGVTTLCDPTPADPTVCTEVKMVPAVPYAPYLATYPDWPTDGRVGGVPDPNTHGPDFIQIGTEGGFLPMPVVVPNQPITWNMNPTTFNFGNVEKHALLLGPAERADVIVDFSAYAGKTLILYNDAPAAFPALDVRNDPFTGAPDLTDSGGPATTLPGKGPNVRTIMQIKVGGPVASSFTLAGLMAEFTPDHAAVPPKLGVFERSQDNIIVGQTAYNTVYGTTFPSAYPNWGVARIQDFAISFQAVDGTAVSTMTLEPKAIHDEMGATFDEYGRMKAELGLEFPRPSAYTQNFSMQGYADPPTELIKLSDVAFPIGTPGADGTQLWKITHNGVDTHPIHFHLFHVQLVNRVGWDGIIRLPEATELGWKDTLRVSPLEDTIVALRPIAPKPENLPWKLPNSFRPLEPALPIGSTLAFTGIDPLGNSVAVTNEVTDFGWEYVWHCHILSHEENDMMRAVVFAVTPETPTGLTGRRLPLSAGVRLTWRDNSMTADGVRVERDTTAGFSSPGLQGFDATLPPCSIPAGCQRTYDDATAVPGTPYYYRVSAANTVGSHVVGYPQLTAYSLWSNVLLPTDVSITALLPASDFDGDNRADVAVYRPSTGTWFSLDSSTSNATSRYHGWGVDAAGDVPVRGDFDGDGVIDPAVFRPSTGTWFILKSSSNFLDWTWFGWGAATDRLVPADYDGDRITDAAVYRPSTGTWYIHPSSGATPWNMAFGQPGDQPVPGDYDGDLKTDLAVYRPASGTWFILTSSSGYTAWYYRGWGVDAQGDTPVPGFYDGDLKTDIAVFRPSTGTWFILQSSTNDTGWNWFGWGQVGDIPMPADYDGDGVTDAAVYRPSTGTWFVRPSSGAVQWSLVFGVAGDMPLLLVR